MRAQAEGVYYFALFSISVFPFAFLMPFLCRFPAVRRHEKKKRDADRQDAGGVSDIDALRMRLGSQGIRLFGIRHPF